MGACSSIPKERPSVTSAKSTGVELTASDDGLAFRVKLISALNLKARARRKSESSGEMLFENRDPYVVLTASGSAQRFVSSLVVGNRADPTWNEEFYFVAGAALPTLTLEVWDKNFVSTDEFVGKAVVSLEGVLGRRGDRECWVPLLDPTSLDKLVPDITGEIGFSVVECYRVEVRPEKVAPLLPVNKYIAKASYFDIRVGTFQERYVTARSKDEDPTWDAAESRRFFVPYGQRSQLDIFVWTSLPAGGEICRGFAHVPLRGEPTHVQDFKKLELELTVATAREAAKTETPPVATVYVRDDGSTGSVDVEARRRGAAEEEEGDGVLHLPPERPQTRVVTCKVAQISGLTYERPVNDDTQRGAVGDFVSSVRQKARVAAGSLGMYMLVSYADQAFESGHVYQEPVAPWVVFHDSFIFTLPPRLLRSQLNPHGPVKSPPPVPANLKVELFDHLMSGRVPASQPFSAKEQVEALQHGRPLVATVANDAGEKLDIELRLHHNCVVRVLSCHVFHEYDMNGLCDPFVSVRMCGSHFQTRIIKETRHAVFADTHRISIPAGTEASELKLRLKLYDADFVLLNSKELSKDLVGMGEIDVAALPPRACHRFTVPMRMGMAHNADVVLEVTNNWMPPREVLVVHAARFGFRVPPNLAEVLAAKGGFSAEELAELARGSDLFQAHEHEGLDGPLRVASDPPATWRDVTAAVRDLVRGNSLVVEAGDDGAQLRALLWPEAPAPPCEALQRQLVVRYSYGGDEVEEASVGEEPQSALQLEPPAGSEEGAAAQEAFYVDPEVAAAEAAKARSHLEKMLAEASGVQAQIEKYQEEAESARADSMAARKARAAELAELEKRQMAQEQEQRQLEAEIVKLKTTATDEARRKQEEAEKQLAKLSAVQQKEKEKEAKLREQVREQEALAEQLAKRIADLRLQEDEALHRVNAARQEAEQRLREAQNATTDANQKADAARQQLNTILGEVDQVNGLIQRYQQDAERAKAEAEQAKKQREAELTAIEQRKAAQEAEARALEEQVAELKKVATSESRAQQSVIEGQLADLARRRRQQEEQEAALRQRLAAQEAEVSKSTARIAQLRAQEEEAKRRADHAKQEAELREQEAARIAAKKAAKAREELNSILDEVDNVSALKERYEREINEAKSEADRAKKQREAELAAIEQRKAAQEAEARALEKRVAELKKAATSESSAEQAQVQRQQAELQRQQAEQAQQEAKLRQLMQQQEQAAAQMQQRIAQLQAQEEESRRRAEEAKRDAERREQEAAKSALTTTCLSSKRVTPAYWSEASQKTDSLVQVELTNDPVWAPRFQALLDDTCRRNTLGAGRDQVIKAGRYDRLVLHRVWRLENPKLYTLYAMTRDIRVGAPTERIMPKTHAVPSSAWIEKELGLRWDDRNEIMGWHGTKPEIVDIISNEGFDERVCSLNGLFGAALYFADEVSKSDQYVTPTPANKPKTGYYHMYFCRVTMGTFHSTSKAHKEGRRAPAGADSLLGQIDRNKYKEYCVYDRNQCYPEFLIQYKREYKR